MIDPHSQIRAHLERAAQLDSEARRHRRAAGLLLADVKAENASQGFWWRDEGEGGSDFYNLHCDERAGGGVCMHTWAAFFARRGGAGWGPARRGTARQGEGFSKREIPTCIT